MTGLLARESLDAIGRHHSSDKSSMIHGYLEVFEGYFEKLRDEEFTLLEFGPDRGSSVRVWLDYFSRAQIVSIHPKVPDDFAELRGHPRLTIIHANQHDPQCLIQILERWRPMIIIDDGWHLWRDQLAALLALFPGMPSGGLYILEDTPTTAPDKAKQYAAGSDISPLQCMLRAAQALAVASPAPIESPQFGLSAISALIAQSARSLCFGRGFVMLTRNAQPVANVLPTRPLSDAADHLEQVDTGGSYQRIEAELIDCPGWLMRRFSATVQPAAEVPPLPGLVGWLHGATVHGRGLVTTKGGALVKESLINTEEDIATAGFLKLEAGRCYANMLPNRSVTDVTGAPRVLLKQTWDSNYGHWLIESLPRVALVAAVTNLAECRFIVQDEAPQMRAVYLDSLSYFGITRDRVEFTSFDSMRVETLIYPAPVTRQPWVKAPFVIRLLEHFPTRAQQLLPPSVLPRRIYVTRSSAYKRRLINEAEIVAYLAQRGFTIVTPEHLSFWEQVAMFSQAEIVVGLLGAGLSNLVFSPAGVTCIALATELMGDDFFYDIICHKRGRYISIHGKAADPALGMHSDFNISVEKLARYVR